MTEKFKILGQYIKDMSSETPDIETFIFVKDYISKYQLNIDIHSKPLKNKMVEVNTVLKFEDKEKVEIKSLNSSDKLNYQSNNNLHFLNKALSLGGFYLSFFPSFDLLQFLYAFWGFSTTFLFWSAMIKATRNWGGDNKQGRAFLVILFGNAVGLERRNRIPS